MPEPPGQASSPESSGRGGIPTPILVVIGAAMVAAIGLLLTMPGGSKTTSTALSPIAQAAERTARVSGARFTGTGSGSFEGGSMTMTMSGVYDSGAQRSRVDASMQATGPESISMSISGVQDGLVTYMSSPLLTGQLPNGAQWIRVDYSQLGADSSDVASTPMDGREMLDQLAAISGETQTVGRESVRGVTTTRYRGTLDLTEDAPELSEASSGAVDVWIDRKSLVRRVDMQIFVALPGETPAQIAMSVEFFDFGIKPDIAIPAANDTVDFTQLGQQALEVTG